MTNRITEATIRKILADRQAVITDSHFVYAQPKGRGDHGDTYVNKDAIYPDTDAVSTLCEAMSERLEGIMSESAIQAVVGPEKGGIILSQWLAHWLNEDYPPEFSDEKTLAVYAEKSATGGFKLSRGYDKIIDGKDVVIVEDILNTGGSAKDVVSAVRSSGGNVLGVIAICNRGSVTKECLDVPFLEALVSMSDLKKYPEDECPLCKANVLVRTDLGHGAEFKRKVQCQKI